MVATDCSYPFTTCDPTTLPQRTSCESAPGDRLRWTASIRSSSATVMPEWSCRMVRSDDKQGVLGAVQGRYRRQMAPSPHGSCALWLSNRAWDVLEPGPPR